MRSLPNYSMMENALRDKLREIENMLMYLEKSEYEPENHDFNFELMEVKFKLERSIRKCTELKMRKR